MKNRFYFIETLVVTSVLIPALLNVPSLFLFGFVFFYESGGIALGLAIFLLFFCLYFFWDFFIKVFINTEKIPESAFKRYLPFAVAISYHIMTWIIVFMVSNYSYVYTSRNILFLLFPYILINVMYTRIIEYIPLMLILPCIVNLASAIMFTVVCIKQKRKLTNFKGILILPSVILILVGVVFVQFYYRSTIYITIPHGTYSTVIDDIELEDYLPYTNKKSRLETFNGTPNLVISSDYPKLDGATALYPVYAAIGKAIYEGLGVNSIEYFVMCSKTIGAYEKLINGEVDIIFVAQPSKQQEEMAKEKGVELNFTPIAREAFVFIVNTSNPVENLTIKQIQDIYTKKIKNWKIIGGNDEKIMAFQRPENSGSQTAMLATVMKGKTLPKPVRAEYSAMEEMMGGLITRVADYVNYPASIGYSFRFFATEMNKGANIKLLAIEGILPTPENIANGTYPLAGDVYAVTAGTKNKNVELLLEWILSEQGQNFIEQCGYVKIK